MKKIITAAIRGWHSAGSPERKLITDCGVIPEDFFDNGGKKYLHLFLSGEITKLEFQACVRTIARQHNLFKI